MLQGEVTFVDDALKSWIRWSEIAWPMELCGSNILITLKRRLEMAAAAMAHKMTMRNKERVLAPLSPLRNMSNPSSAIVRDI